MEETVTEINGGIMINVDLSVKIVMYGENIVFGILLHVIVKMENIRQVLWMIQLYDDKTNFINKATCRKKNFYILIALFKITIALLITVSIYCYLIKYQAKQKHLLPFNFTKN